MKRRELLQHLGQYGCQLLREGSRHSIFQNPVNKQTTAVPRHSEIGSVMVRKICHDLGIPPP